MTPAIIAFAISAVALNIVLFMWFRGSMAAASARRMKGMIARLGLGRESAILDFTRTGAIMADTRRRCRRCPRDDYCNRWLAGEVEGSNAFCPNAPVFDKLAGAAGGA